MSRYRTGSRETAVFVRLFDSTPLESELLGSV
jgi:hypothetical protein